MIAPRLAGLLSSSSYRPPTLLQIPEFWLQAENRAY